ncbi:hypothetical protein [Echinicola vietnamensis]|uniref:Lipoprotein n=1 Tax=Echinicola vietnamensis (strain DSM 17526 / LMG 23754 / KMM 6221) TaxID=926556 RepID=L0FXZ8_ECHVK|nr:hypothetical protein [Echinicola vietnamensis]AGA78172.1 hypothetical protein Echvi_1917 [Echinicola vietnamensis DSM 17526]
MSPLKSTYWLLFCSLIFASGCSCNPEKLIQWVASSDLFKGTEEVKAIGGFGRVASSFHKDYGNDSSKIELRLYDGTHPELYENEANIARLCAKAFVEASDSHDYQDIEVFIIKTDANDPFKAIYQSQYLFEVASLTKDTPPAN